MSEYRDYVVLDAHPVSSEQERDLEGWSRQGFRLVAATPHRLYLERDTPSLPEKEQRAN